MTYSACALNQLSKSRTVQVVLDMSLASFGQRSRAGPDCSPSHLLETQRYRAALRPLMRFPTQTLQLLGPCSSTARPLLCSMLSNPAPPSPGKTSVHLLSIGILFFCWKLGSNSPNTIPRGGSSMGAMSRNWAKW